MENNKELTVYAGYKEYKAALDSELAKTAEGFVRIGYLLRLAADSDILKESGYKNVLEFAQKEYGLDKSQVSRFIAINAKFSENGYSDRLEAHYQGFGYAKLSIMLQLPDSINEILTPDFSKAEIQSVKHEVDEERNISDLEMLTEQVVINMDNMNTLQKALYQIGRENPELFLKLYEVKAAEPKEYQEILAPAGEGLISIRIQGIGRMMLSIKDVERDVTLVNVRSNEKENFPWEQVVDVISELTGRNVDSRPENAKKWWELVYDEEYPIDEKTEVAPVQQTPQEQPKPRKESKVTTAKTEPPKAEKKSIPPVKKEEPEPKEEPKAVEPEPPMPEPGPEEEVSEKPEIAPVQPESEPGVEGQLELERDFPEYCPDGYVVSADGTEVIPASTEKYTGPRYEVKDVVCDYGLFDNGQLALICLSRRNALLIKAIMEKEQKAGNMGDYYFCLDDCKRFFGESEE